MPTRRKCVELWPISSGSHMTTVPTREAEKPPKTTALASENTKVWVLNGGLIE